MDVNDINMDARWNLYKIIKNMPELYICDISEDSSYKEAFDKTSINRIVRKLYNPIMVKKLDCNIEFHSSSKKLSKLNKQSFMDQFNLNYFLCDLVVAEDIPFLRVDKKKDKQNIDNYINNLNFSVSNAIFNSNEDNNHKFEFNESDGKLYFPVNTDLFFTFNKDKLEKGRGMYSGRIKLDNEDEDKIRTKFYDLMSTLKDYKGFKKTLVIESFAAKSLISIASEELIKSVYSLNK